MQSRFGWLLWMICLLVLYPLRVHAQTASQSASAVTPEAPQANPGRPTVSTPATLTPVGYLQFETGMLSAWRSPEVSSQTSLGEVIKFSPSRWIEFLASSQPFAYSNVNGTTGTAPGDTSLGAQAVLHHGEGAIPTVSASYFRRVYSGSAPNLDIGSAVNSVLVLASADVHGFHYDTNFIFNEQENPPVRRAQFGQTLSVSHPLPRNFGISGEIWRFTQPFLHGNAVGNLWAINYNVNRDLVFDGGFDHGLTSTSTHWEVFTGFTYLLPHALFGHNR